MDSTSPEPILISALEHWSYCPRQCALIHLEQTFSENVHTIRGQHSHERAHAEAEAHEGDVHVVRGMTLWSDRLGLVGKADVVEFHGDQPLPVEYKVGKRGPWRHAELQLGAQALCLEEMLHVDVPQGAVFFRGSGRRRTVAIDDDLRAAVCRAVQDIRGLLRGTVMPPPVNDARCTHCSLQDTCMPEVVARPRRVQLLHTALFKPYSPADPAVPE